MMELRKCVEPYLFLSVFAMSIILFTHSWVILRSACLTEYSEEICHLIWNHKNNTKFKVEEKLVQYTASKWNLIGNVIFGILSVILSNFYGNLEDVRGRKFTLVLLSIGNLISFGISLIIPFLQNSPQASLYAVTSFQLVAGFFGGIPVLLSMCFGYLSHMIEAEKFTVRFGILETAFFVGIFVGPLITGYALDHLGLMYTIVMATVIMSMAMLYSIFVLKSDNVKGKNVPCKHIFNPFDTIRNISEVVCNHQIQPRRTVLPLLLGGGILSALAFQGTMSLLYLYLRKTPIMFTNSEMGMYSAIHYLIQGCGMVVIMPFLSRVIKLHDIFIVLIGAVCKMFFIFILALARERWTVYVALVFGVGSFDTPALRSLLVKQVEKSESGRVLGILGSFYSIGFLGGQFILQPIYMATLSFFPGLAFLICASLYVIEIIMLLMIHRVLVKSIKFQAVAQNENDLKI